MSGLTDEEKIRFRKWIKEDFDWLAEDISVESGVEKEKVEKVLDSLRCYILFTTKDSDESCIMHEKHQRTKVQ